MDKLYTLNEIFNGRIFRIPDYQRGYAWRAEEQVTDFWDDLNNLQPGRKHYTGLLSLDYLGLEETASWNDEQWLIEELEYKPAHVVDGQQRLTTAVILIQAIYDFMKELHPEEDESKVYIGQISLKSIKSKFISLTEKKGTITTYLFGYESDNPSYNYLKNHIFHDKVPTSNYETYYTLNLENAYKFFMNNIRLLHEQEGEKGVIQMYKKLTQCLVFNLFEMESAKKDFDVFAAFESMNNRGKRLSKLELLKNRLIYLTTLYSDSELSPRGKDSLRRTINDAWKVVYEQLGRKKTSPLDDDEFLQTHWIIKFPYTRAQGVNFAEDLLEKRFSIAKVQKKKSINTGVTVATIVRDADYDEEDTEDTSIYESELKPKDIKDYVQSLSEAAVKWYYTWFPFDAEEELTEDEKIWIDNLNRIGIASFRPLVTSSLIVNLRPETRVRLFKAIERFIFIAFRCQIFQTNYRNSEYYKYAKSLVESDNPESFTDIIISTLVNNLNYAFYETPDNPGIKYFKADFLRNTISRKGGLYYEWGVRHYVLYEYEKHLADQYSRRRPLMKWTDFVKAAKGKLSIEHIYPQTPDNEYWVSRFSSFTEEERKNLQGSLGNLMLLSQSINSSLQNDSFPDKKAIKKDEDGNIIRQGYCNGSYSEQDVASCKEWTAEEIKARGLKMIEFIEKRWGMPIKTEKERLSLLFVPLPKEKADGDIEQP